MTEQEETRSPSAEAAEMVKKWTPDDFRAFGFYMCGFAPAEVIYFSRHCLSEDIEERAS